MTQDSDVSTFDEQQLPLTAITAQVSRRVTLSRDEMNLAEFPLTVLSTRVDPKVKTLEFSDTIRGKSGDVVSRQWIITGADKFGLPTASDDEVLLGLMKLTVDDEFRSRKVYFTRYELLRVLRWTTEGRSYSRLQNALDRLSGVRIKASNAFFDNESKSHSTRNFGIIDAYEINDGRDTKPKPSFFQWSDVLFKSFQTGFIKKIDLDFYLDLGSAVSKRLYRYLDKHFWYRASVTVNVFTLCHEKIGISRNYRYVSSIRQQLDPALDELKACGFVAGYEYQGRGDGTELTVYAASGKPRSLERKDGAGKGQGAAAPSRPVVEIETPKGKGEQEFQDLVLTLEARGLRSQQAEQLLSAKKPEEIARIRQIVEHFDFLVKTGSKLVSRSPVGFLYRAVENPARFSLPSDGQKKPSKQVGPKFAAGAATGAAGKESNSLESEYLVWRRREIDKIKQSVEPDLLAKIKADVGLALQKLRGIISDQRLSETIDHGVEEKLASLMAIPDFSEWKKA